MKTTRLLFPFSHDIDANAIEHAVHLAKQHNATLVPVSLIRVPEKQKMKAVRLEIMQQSRDFLEAVSHKASKFQVPVEQVEVLTSDVEQSVGTLTKKLACDGVLLFIKGKDGILLDSNDIQHIVERADSKFYVFHIEAKGSTNVHLCQ